MSFLFRISPRGISSLRQYTRDSTLPPLGYDPELDPILPAPGHVSHANHLAVRPETYRALTHIYGIGENIWESLQQCLDIHIPTTKVGSASRVGFTVPQRLQGEFQCNLDARPDHIQRIIPWVDRFPLATVKRILHLSVPETKKWAFQPRVYQRNHGMDPDGEIFTYFTWSLNRNGPVSQRELKSSEDKRVLVAIQPPWVLTERDLRQFADCREFPPFMVPDRRLPEGIATAKERLWAKMWDSCAREGIHYFVVTSYTHWVFGVFSEGYTTGFTTSVIPFDNVVPTVVEMLSYWTLSAMGMEGGYNPPPVSDEVDGSSCMYPTTLYDMLGITDFDEESKAAWLAACLLPVGKAVNIKPHRFRGQCPDPVDSDSDWGGSSIASDQNSVKDCPSFGSFSGGEEVYEENIYSPTKRNQFPVVMDWIRETLTEASRNEAELNMEVDYKDPLEDFPYVIQVFREPRLPGREATHVGTWLA